jgi:hypothetical protein
LIRAVEALVGAAVAVELCALVGAAVAVELLVLL